MSQESVAHLAVPSLAVPDALPSGDTHRVSLPPGLLDRPAPPCPEPALTPLRVPTSTFETHRLVATGPHRLELRKTATERLFSGLLAPLGTGLLALGVGLGAGAELDLAPWLAPSLALLAMLACGTLLWRAGGRALFDGRAGEFRRSGGVLASHRRAIRVRFDDIVAVQRLPCPIAEEEVRWGVHQLNLVRRDGSRVHVCSHVDETLATESAERVARLLGVDVLADG